ncbi:hypothetical protein PY254_12005 [Rhodanobacter sp. AS-Z3]|uniref:hypothetical protein n=1 Tax=Rhodanobacter sp. AS-Z3 TaxID=3031330 RepID=UPI0024791E57|nr:hypothetical protein [Rhodanobacter sp. AS-Z3]WEN13961.1 hypothetical protein PY254_12005 [Rhodanobacter sp. AS-Z3]
MKRPYRNLGFFFLLLLVLVVAGFTPHIAGTPFFGYFSTLAHHGQVPWIFHLHAAVAVIWFALLSIQPFLIRANRLDLHRWLGRASLVVVALFFFTALQVIKHTYLNDIAHTPRNAVLAGLEQPFIDLTLFLSFYTIALFRRRHFHQHVAFMIAAALASATPGLVRLGLHVVGGLPGILLMLLLMYASLVAFLLYAKFRLHQPVLRSPFLLILVVFFIAHVIEVVGERSAAWLWLADKLVSVL